jgi:uncharacterized protein YjbI with pentapeptide repeats
MNKLISLAFLVFPLLSLATPARAENSEQVERLLKTNQCPNCDLSNADLEDANLFGANLVNANLAGANLQGANLGAANLIDANLTNANLSNAYLYQATVKNTNLSNSILVNSYWREANFENVDLRNANLEGINLSYTDLTDIELQEINLKNANLNHAILSGFNNEYRSAFGAFISNRLFQTGLCQEFSSMIGNFGFFQEIFQDAITSANLEGANLENAQLEKTVIIGGNLKNANLKNANLSGACLSEAKFSNAILEGATFQDATLVGAIIDRASLRNISDADVTETYGTERERMIATQQSEAKSHIDSINRGQRSHYAEREKFSLELEDLSYGIRSETENYTYEIIATSDRTAVHFAQTKKPELKNYLGVVFFNANTGTIQTEVCESDRPNTPIPENLSALVENTSEIRCPQSFQSLSDR